MELKSGQIFIKGEDYRGFTPSGDGENSTNVQQESALGVYDLVPKPEWVTGSNLCPYVFQQIDENPMNSFYTGSFWAIARGDDCFWFMHKGNDNDAQVYCTGYQGKGFPYELPQIWRETGNSLRGFNIIDNFYNSGNFLGKNHSDSLTLDYLKPTGMGVEFLSGHSDIVKKGYPHYYGAWGIKVWAQNKTEKQYLGGTLNFIHGTRQFLSHSQLKVVPEVGDFYFFPHYLMHTVYPFKGSDKERRSISFNAFIDENVFNVHGQQ